MQFTYVDVLKSLKNKLDIDDCETFDVVANGLIANGVRDLFGAHTQTYTHFMAKFKEYLVEIANTDDIMATFKIVEEYLIDSGFLQLFDVNRKLPITDETVALCDHYSGVPFDDKCCVCYNSSIENMFVTICGHAMCRECTLIWFIDYNKLCPICKTEVRYSTQLFKFPKSTINTKYKI